MADISAEIAAFKNAVYGEDVRDALISLANKLNTVVSSADLGKILAQQIYLPGISKYIGPRFIISKVIYPGDTYNSLLIRWNAYIVHRNNGGHGFITQVNITVPQMADIIGSEYLYTDSNNISWIRLPDITTLCYDGVDKTFVVKVRNDVDGIRYIPLIGNADGVPINGLYLPLLYESERLTNSEYRDSVDELINYNKYLELDYNINSIVFRNGIRSSGKNIYNVSYYASRLTNIYPLYLIPGDVIHVECNDQTMQYVIANSDGFDSGWITGDYDYTVYNQAAYVFSVRKSNDAIITPSDANSITFNISHKSLFNKLIKESQKCDSVFNAIASEPYTPYMMLGGLYFNNNALWTFSNANNVVCTPLSYHCYLTKGTVVKLTNYSDAMFYVGRRNMDTEIGEYLSGWLYDDYTIPVNGDYGFLVKKRDGSDISSNYQDYISLLKIVPPSSINPTDNYFISKKEEASIFKMQASAGNCVDCSFKAMLISDVHQAWDRVKNVVDLSNNWGTSYIEAVINSGDTAPLVVTDDVTQYYTHTSNLAMPHLTVLGNHDAWATLGNIEPDKTIAYNKFIAPISNQSVITQPSGAATNGLSYYYADFTNTRVICLDCMYYDSTELNWFKSVLSDAITNNKIVICVSHYGFSQQHAANIKCNWSPTLQYIPGSDSAYDALSMDLADAVDDFIDDGGTFICWLFGHTHCNMVSKLDSTHHNQLNIWLPSNANRQVRLLKSDNPGAYNYNVMTYMTVDTFEHSVRFMRIGANLHTNGVEHNGISLDYTTGELNGCW